MHPKVFFTSLLFIYIPVFHLFAQNLLSQQIKQYEYGVSLYEQGKYAPALQVFDDLTFTAEEVISPYVFYFQALSAYKDSKKDKALYALQYILEKNPTWNKIDEARYLLAYILFENNDIENSLKELNNIKNSSLQDDVNNLTLLIVQKLSVEQLTSYHHIYPENTIIGENLLKKLSNVPLAKLDTTFYDKLVAKFDKNNQYSRSQKVKQLYKEVYNFYVMFPFFLDEYNPYDINRKIAKNEEFLLAYDLYEGMRLAVSRLEKEGVKINLMAFDTKKDTLTMKNILQEKGLQSADLIIGPLYRNILQMTSKYANQHLIPMLNPISVSEEVLLVNPLSYLILPSIKTQAKGAAEYALKNFGKTTSAAYILYDNKKEDKELAQSYLAHYRDNGGKVAFFEGFDYTNKRSFDNLVNKLVKLQSDSLAHIFLSINDEIAAINVMSALQNLQLKNPVLVPESWIFSFNRLSFDEMEKYHIHFIAPSFIDYSNATLQKFNQEFMKQTHSAPNKYAYLGFESVYYFGKLMKKYGKGFPDKMKKELPTKGLLLGGYDYRNGNDNAFVPIVRFEKGELKWLNKYLLD
ncbi:MAG: hypothetical protein OHK0038_10600 [Flammeovirgaceae bacterium]